MEVVVNVKDAKAFPRLVIKEKGAWVVRVCTAIRVLERTPMSVWVLACYFHDTDRSAEAEGLSSLDLRSNLSTGFYAQANRTVNGQYFWSTFLLDEVSRQTTGHPRRNCRFQFKHRGQQKSTIRLFPYVHVDGTLRLWDIDENEDL